jgi:hypothetical protein
VYLGFVFAEKDVSPDVRRRCMFVPAARDAFGTYERCGIEIRKDSSSKLSR